MTEQTFAYVDPYGSDSGNAVLVVLIVLLVFAIGGAVLCGYIAKQKGRDPTGWAIFGALLPLPALIALAAIPSLKSGATSAGATVSGMRCPNGHEAPAGTKFCPRCGAALTMKCSQGHTVSADDLFCPECGERVRDAPAAPAMTGVNCQWCQSPVPTPDVSQTRMSIGKRQTICSQCGSWTNIPDNF